MTQCNIVDNAVYGLRATPKEANSLTYVATDNWWGTTDSAAIERMILHYPDYGDYPLVEFTPFATAPITIDDSIPTDFTETPPSTLPASLHLYQNYPNPFNAVTTIQFELPRATNVSLDIYNVLGQRVVRLAEGVYSAGRHSVAWESETAASGVYFYRLTTDQGVLVRKMMLLR